MDILLTSNGRRNQVSAKTEINLAIEFDSKGQNPNNISYKTTPSDHISALEVQISPLSTSGAMQMGLPNMVLAISLALLRVLQKPKSPNLRFPLWKKILSGFRSRCIILYLLSTLNASISCLNILSALFSCSLFSCFNSDSRVLPLQYSQMKQKLFGVFNISTYRTMQGLCQIVDRILISLTVHSYSFGFYWNFFMGITLTANSSLVLRCTALQTLPYMPSPMVSCKAQFSMILPI